ncbi:hypothetical protein FACS1894193_08420 [Bacilli bacterium]|nr:hypothetical protein FACS1894193_08420 [Bacilli bacterium]
MIKYSFDLKLSVVQDYEQGVAGYEFIANKYHVSNLYRVRDWVKIYQTFGSAGLQRKRQNTDYSTQFKLNAVNVYLISEKSYRDISNHLGMTNRTLLARWMLDYRERANLLFLNLEADLEKSLNYLIINQLKMSSLSKTEQELAKLQKSPATKN